MRLHIFLAPAAKRTDFDTLVGRAVVCHSVITIIRPVMAAQLKPREAVVKQSEELASF